MKRLSLTAVLFFSFVASAQITMEQRAAFMGVARPVAAPPPATCNSTEQAFLLENLNDGFGYDASHLWYASKFIGTNDAIVCAISLQLWRSGALPTESNRWAIYTNSGTVADNPGGLNGSWTAWIADSNITATAAGTWYTNALSGSAATWGAGTTNWIVVQTSKAEANYLKTATAESGQFTARASLRDADGAGTWTENNGTRVSSYRLLKAP